MTPIRQIDLFYLKAAAADWVMQNPKHSNREAVRQAIRNIQHAEDQAHAQAQTDARSRLTLPTPKQGGAV